MLKPEILIFLIPLLALMIPIIRMLIGHQAQMAQIIHGQNSQNNVNSSLQLSEEVRQLRELMHQQAIALDNLRDEVRSSHTVQDRINQNS